VAIFLADPDRHGFQLAGHLGPEPPARVEMAPAGPLLDRMAKDHAVVLETLERELGELRDSGSDREAETLFEVAKTLEALHATLCIPIASDTHGLYGFVALRDERVRDAFAPDEVQLLLGLVAQVAISLESSSLYQEMKERDRLLLLGEMAAGLAHEIRNPLGAIKAAAQYLAEPGHEAEGGGAEFLDIIVEETDRLDRVVGSFLDFARPAKGEVAAADIEKAVQRTMQLLGPEIEAAGCRWSLVKGPDLPPVRIDVEELRQVLINLVKNAVQAMARGGEVRVELAKKARSGGSDPNLSWVQLRVADTGPGIPKEMLPKIFLPFVTTKEGGTGLGLAISQRIVNAAGGRIEARSTERGTTFVVQLPAVDTTPSEPSYSPVEGEPAPSRLGSGSTERLLVAAEGDVDSGSTTSR
jgi:two-component system, NtrC family, sensor histidine kinase HydH